MLFALGSKLVPLDIDLRRSVRYLVDVSSGQQPNPSRSARLIDWIVEIGLIL